MPLHVSSTCVHHLEFKTALHSLLYHHTYRWPSGAQLPTGGQQIRCTFPKSCTYSQSAHEDGRNYRPKHVEQIYNINNNVILLHLGYEYYHLLPNLEKIVNFTTFFTKICFTEEQMLLKSVKITAINFVMMLVIRKHRYLI